MGLRTAIRSIAAMAAGASIAYACSSTPSGVLDKEDMASLLADLYIGESIVDNDSRAYRDDSVKRVLRQSIYARNGITVEEADSSLAWYGRHMDKFTEVYDRTIEILEGRLEKANEAVDNQTGTGAAPVALDGDSVDVWPSARYFRFAPNLPAEIIAFSLSSDRYWERGDTYTLRAKTDGTTLATTIRIAVDYYDGTTESVTSSTGGGGWKEAVLVLDSAKVASNVYGTISYPSRQVAAGDGAVAFIDSLTLFRTRWDDRYSHGKRRGLRAVRTK